MDSDEVSYEPVSVVAVLREMKNTAALMVDLAYSAVVFEDRDLAGEALELEAEMDLLQLQARMSLVMAGRRPAEAEQLAPVFGVVNATEKISDAAGDVAGVVRDEIGLPAAFATTLPAAVEPIARLELVADSPYADRTLGASDVETDTGVRVFAVRRGDDWLLNPTRETTLRAGDVLLCRGPVAGLARVHETVTGEPLDDDTAFHGHDRPNGGGDTATAGGSPDATPSTESIATPSLADQSIPDLDRAVETVVTMKDASELAVDLAYGSVLFDSVELAREVRELEVEVDALQSRFEAWALQAASAVDDPVAIRGLLRIAASTEAISDAALQISEGVLRGLGGHPVVEAAVRESDEVLIRETIQPGSDLDGTTVGDAAVETETGMHVVAVRHPSETDGTVDSGVIDDPPANDDPTATDATDRRYVLSPPAGTELRAGDVLLATGTRASAERLGDWTG